MKLRYTCAFISEVLRLYPPVWSVSRYSVQDHVVKAWHLPAETNYLIHTYLIQRDDRYWKDAQLFDPARFLESNEPKHKAAYHPFSLGKRTCIGMGFSLYEMIFLVAKIVKEYHVIAVDEPFDTVPLYTVISTVRPQSIRLEKR